MDRFISLTLGELSLTFRKFPNDTYPRAKATSEAPSRSTYGTFVGYGKGYEDPHVWAFTALINETQMDILEAMHSEFELLRRTFQPTAILIADTTKRVHERAPRSRAIVSNTTIETVGTGKIAYFAQYYGWFSKAPEFVNRGRYIAATIALEEKNEKVAP